MIYREDDWVAEVEVLKSECDKKWDRYTLKVIRTISPSEIFMPVKDGTVFSVEQMKGVAFGGMWRLGEE